MRDLDPYGAKVCFKLYRNRCFGKGHVLADNVVRGFPSQETKAVKKAVQALLRAGILVERPTRHGKALHIPVALRLEVWSALRRATGFGWLPK